MAFVSQELKAQIAPQVKAICQKYGVQGRLAVDRHSTLVLNIKSADIDFIGSYNRVCALLPRPAHLPFQPATTSLSVNCYWYTEHFDGKALEFLQEVIPVMNRGNHDRSDISTDYFDVGWYVNVNIGKWDKPFIFNKA